MSNTADIQRIKQKLKQLIEQQHALQNEKRRLTDEIEKLKGALTDQRSQNQGLTDQLSAAMVRTTGLSQEEKSAIEKKINHYIKEIDRCISQLGN
jgi:ABC-type transporter Mla subunit MlaD